MEKTKEQLEAIIEAIRLCLHNKEWDSETPAEIAQILLEAEYMVGEPVTDDE